MQMLMKTKRKEEKKLLLGNNNLSVDVLLKRMCYTSMYVYMLKYNNNLPDGLLLLLALVSIIGVEQFV